VIAILSSLRRRASFALAFLAFTAVAAVAKPRAPAESSYERALAAYQATEYSKAHELWLAALAETGPDAPDRATVLYDLGNVAFRRKRPLEAAAWYTASLRLSPRDDDARHNLELVRREAGLEPADRGDLRSTARRLLTMLTVAECETLALAIGALLAVALAWEALRGGTAAKATSFVLAGLLAAALAPWGYQVAAGGRELVFVTQPEGAELRSEPREGSALIGRLSPAAEVERIDSVPGWMRVAQGESRGWIASDACVPLTEPYRP
jgi:tetratricopeptide (TPR) repeat protein